MKKLRAGPQPHITEMLENGLPEFSNRDVREWAFLLGPQREESKVTLV